MQTLAHSQEPVNQKFADQTPEPSRTEPLKAALLLPANYIPHFKRVKKRAWDKKWRDAHREARQAAQRTPEYRAAANARRIERKALAALKAEGWS